MNPNSEAAVGRYRCCAIRARCGNLESIGALPARSTYLRRPGLRKRRNRRIPVRYTDVRESAKITFQQDSTQTEEKYYLETMGTGVAWIDYDQDGLMDLFFVQSAATDIYKPAASACAARSITTTATGLSLTSPRKLASVGKATTARELRSVTSTTTVIPICTSPAMAAPFSITTTAMVRSPT